MKNFDEIDQRSNDDGDDLDLVPEALKDLAVAVGRAKQVGGGSGQTAVQHCECGTA